MSHKGMDHKFDDSQPPPLGGGGGGPGYDEGFEPVMSDSHDNLLFHCPRCILQFELLDEFTEHIKLCGQEEGFSFDEVESAIGNLSPVIPPEQQGDIEVEIPKSLSGLYHPFDWDLEVQSECGICFEEFVLKQRVARLDCLCVFHLLCIEDWYRRLGKQRCPVHGTDCR